MGGGREEHPTRSIRGDGRGSGRGRGRGGGRGEGGGEGKPGDGGEENQLEVGCLGFSKWQGGVEVEEDELEQGAHGPGCGAEGEDRWNRTR